MGYASVLEKRLILCSSHILALGITYFAVSLFGIAINLLVIIALVKTGQMKTSFNKIILVLSLSDLCYSLSAIPLCGIIFTVYRSTYSPTLEVISTFLVAMNGYFSVFVVVWAALDRYMNTDPDLSNKNVVKVWIKSRIGFVVIICFSFFLSVVFGTLSIFNRNTIARYIYLILYICTYTAYILLYVRLYMRVRYFQLKYADILKHNHNRRNEAAHYSHQLTRTMLVLIGVVTVCYLPWLATRFAIVVFETDGDGTITQTLWLANYTLFVLIFLSTGLNSVIILYRNKKLKNYILNLLRKGHS